MIDENRNDSSMTRLGVSLGVDAHCQKISPIRMTRPREVSKLRDMGLEVTDRSKI